MAERVVTIRLSATVDDYNRGMREAAQSTREVGSEQEKLAQTRQAMQTLGVAGVAMGAALAAGIGVAVSKFAEFDQAMSFVAATGEDARENMDALRQAALDAGASTVFSATESANAIEEMAKAGLSARDILAGGLTGALDLAAAGGLGVAEAAGIASTTLKQFELDGDDATHVADLLAAGAGKAMGDVTDLGGALNQAGLVASQFGLSVDETVGTLSAFASAGMLGSDAGTSMRTMLLRLANPTKEVTELMESLGINAYDTSGNFVGLSGLAGELETGLRGMTQAQRDQTLAMIFGQDAIRGANILLREGADGIDAWTEKVDDQGYAAETAAQRLDNLMGDWEALTGAMDTAFISMGAGADGPLRAIVQGLTELVDGFNGLPDWAQQSALGIAVLTAGIGLVGGAALLAVPRIVEFQIAMQVMGVTGVTTRASLASMASFLTGPWGVALVAAAASVVALKMAQDALKTSTEEFQNVIKNAQSADDLFSAADSAVPFFSRIKEATADVDAFKSKLDVIANNDFLRGLDGSASQLKNSLGDIGEELAKTAETDLPAAQRAFRLLADQYKLTNDEQLDLLGTMQPLRDALRKYATQNDINVSTLSDAENAQALLNIAMGEMPDVADEADAALVEMEEAAQEADEALQGTAQALADIAGEALALGDAKDAALGAINALTEAAEAEGSAIDGTNDASIKLRDSIREVETAHRDSAEAIINNGGTLADAQIEWDKGRESVLKMLEAKGMDRDEAIAWADQNLGAASEVKAGIDEVYQAWLNLPENKQIKVQVETEAAAQKLSDLKARLEAIRPNYYSKVTLETINIGGRTIDSGANANGGVYNNGVKEFANSGFEPGIYPYTPGGIHKFAEEYGEAYISMDPARQQRSRGVWMESGERLGMFPGAGQSQTPVQVSLAGAEFTMMIDGNPVRAVVQEQIVAYDSSRQMSTRGGVRT